MSCSVQPLHLAVHAGNLRGVEVLLRQKAALESRWGGFGGARWDGDEVNTHTNTSRMSFLKKGGETKG